MNARRRARKEPKGTAMKIFKNSRELDRLKLTAILTGVSLLAILSVLILTIPGFIYQLYRVLGITPNIRVPTTGSGVPIGVHFVDVGQGDAILIEDNGQFALIDAGPSDNKDYLLAYLQVAGVERLEYVFMTHPHEDHIGGMAFILDQIPVGKFISPNFQLAPLHTSPSLESLDAVLMARQTPVEVAALGAVYPLGNGSIQVVHAGLPTEDNYNLLSLGLMFESDGIRFLTTGDGETANEQAMLESGYLLEADLYKAAHHGSNTSNAPAFLMQVRPYAVVISCGERNPYGHPHRDVIVDLITSGVRLFRTDQNGTVVVRPTGLGVLSYGISRGGAQGNS